MLPPIDSSQFTGRKEKLKAIIRYGKFPQMFYRTNLWTHTHRMSWMVEAVADAVKSVYPMFDVELARTMAFVHDDIEMIIGDIMYGAKLNMSKAQMDALKQEELNAVKKLASQYPEKMNGYSYGALMKRYEHLAADDLEAQIVKYIDKFDSVGEGVHELLAGNKSFLYGFSAETLPPLVSLMPFFEKVYDTYPIFGPILLPDVAAMVAQGKPHTEASLQKNTSYPPYNIWKHIVRTHGGDMGKNMLLIPTE